MKYGALYLSGWLHAWSFKPDDPLSSDRTLCISLGLGGGRCELDSPTSLPKCFNPLTLPMLRLLSPEAQGRKDFWKASNPCHVGIHWIALAEYSQMSTHMPGFQSFFRFFHNFVAAKSASSSIKVNAHIGQKHNYFKNSWPFNAHSSLTILMKSLTLMLQVAIKFGQYKMMRKNTMKKLLKPLHMGTHLRVLIQSYPMNNYVTGIRWFLKIFASLFFGSK